VRLRALVSWVPSCDQKFWHDGQKSLRKISPVDGLHVCFGLGVGEGRKRDRSEKGVKGVGGVREEVQGEVLVMVCMQSMCVVFVMRHIFDGLREAWRGG